MKKDRKKEDRDPISEEQNKGHKNILYKKLTYQYTNYLLDIIEYKMNFLTNT